MLHAMTLVTFSLNKIVQSLFHSLVTDGVNDAAQVTSTRSQAFLPEVSVMVILNFQ